VEAADESGLLDGVVGISSHILNVHLRSGWFRKAKLKSVIGNSYERSVTDGGILRQSYDDLYDFGYIGRLHSTKGVDLFLQSLERLRKETGIPYRAIIAGTGDPSYEWSLRDQYADSLNDFVGYISPESFFNKVKYCVVPSTWFEPFGRIFIESLHYGIPVLGSVRGGGAEILSQGQTGWLFEPSLDSLVGAMRNAITITDKDYQSMQVNCRLSADQYSVSAIAQQYEELYINLCERAL